MMKKTVRKDKKIILLVNKVAMPIFSFQEIEPIDMRRMEKEYFWL